MPSDLGSRATRTQSAYSNNCRLQFAHSSMSFLISFWIPADAAYLRAWYFHPFYYTTLLGLSFINNIWHHWCGICSQHCQRCCFEQTCASPRFLCVGDVTWQNCLVLSKLLCRPRYSLIFLRIPTQLYKSMLSLHASPYAMCRASLLWIHRQAHSLVSWL